MSATSITVVLDRAKSATARSPLALFAMPGGRINCIFASTVLGARRIKKDINFIMTVSKTTAPSLSATLSAGLTRMSSQAQMCCGQIADKGKLLRDQQRVVAAFDELDRRQKELDFIRPDIEGMEKAFEELKAAIAYLRG